MKVLYLHTGKDDFLNLCTFHGLRSLLGENCVEFPRFDQAYNTYTKEQISGHKGGGFTVYGLLNDLPQLNSKRQIWKESIHEYDLIVITDIPRLWPTAADIKKRFPKKKIALLDGYDSTAIFPWESILKNLKQQPQAFLQRFKQFIYFKREADAKEALGSAGKLLPRKLVEYLELWPTIYPASFSIPEEKITRVTSQSKSKPFPLQIIDSELAEKLDAVFNPLGSDQRFFETEEEYFADLQATKFGITGKRAGWDCFRHYEMAANGCVLCFRDLDLKPQGCAPFGLDHTNSINYNSVSELLNITGNISDPAYEQLLSNTYRWIQNNTTVAKAEALISTCFPA